MVSAMRPSLEARDFGARTASSAAERAGGDVVEVLGGPAGRRVGGPREHLGDDGARGELGFVFARPSAVTRITCDGDYPAGAHRIESMFKTWDRGYCI